MGIRPLEAGQDDEGRDAEGQAGCEIFVHRLPEERPKVLVQDWFKDSQSRGRVKDTVEGVLYTHLPESYNRLLFVEKCNNVFDLMLNYASQGQKWVANWAATAKELQPSKP